MSCGGNVEYSACEINRAQTRSMVEQAWPGSSDVFRSRGAIIMGPGWAGKPSHWSGVGYLGLSVNCGPWRHSGIDLRGLGARLGLGAELAWSKVICFGGVDAILE